MKWNSGAAALAMLFVVSPLPSNAATLLLDHFDDGALDPAWNISFENATDWTFTESGTELTVTGLDATVINPGPGGTWAVVTLDQTFVALTDFMVGVDLSWDSADSDSAMQALWVRVRDAGNNPIAVVAYRDHWISYSGDRRAEIGAANFSDGSDSLPYAGSASVKIVRTAGAIDILWNEVSLLSGVDSTEVTNITLSFTHNAIDDGGSLVSSFGAEIVDRVYVTDGSPVPVELQTFTVE